MVAGDGGIMYLLSWPVIRQEDREKEDEDEMEEREREIGGRGTGRWVVETYVAETNVHRQEDAQTRHGDRSDPPREIVEA